MPRSCEGKTGAGEGSSPYEYEYIILPGGHRFDIPEGEDKQEWIQYFDDASRASREVIARHGDGRPADGINRAAILPCSAHRDGSIYSVTNGWHKRYRISDTNQSEPSTSFFFPLNFYLSIYSSKHILTFRVKLNWSRWHFQTHPIANPITKLVKSISRDR